MLQLLWQGLQAICQDINITDQWDAYSHPLQALFTAQQEIGWDQLYYSWISAQWAHYITTSSQYKINGHVFYSQVIDILWTYILDCWKQWNHHLHYSDTAPLDFQVLAEQVQQILETSNNNPALANAAPTQTVEQILQ